MSFLNIVVRHEDPQGPQVPRIVWRMQGNHVSGWVKARASGLQTEVEGT